MPKADKVYVKYGLVVDEEGNLVEGTLYWRYGDEYKEFPMDNLSQPTPRHASKSGGHGYAIDFTCKGLPRTIFIEPHTNGLSKGFVQCDKRAEGIRDD